DIEGARGRQRLPPRAHDGRHRPGAARRHAGGDARGRGEGDARVRRADARGEPEIRADGHPLAPGRRDPQAGAHPQPAGPAQGDQGDARRRLCRRALLRRSDRRALHRDERGRDQGVPAEVRAWEKTVSPERIEVETGAKPVGTVIWLHGLGADGHDFEPIVPELGLPAAKPLRFIFPHAPMRPVTINMGMRMRAWYDILQLGGGPEDDKGIRASQALLENLIKEENKRGIKSEHIVLAGFSQGGAIVLQTGLRYPEPLGGIMALSTYLPLSARVAEERHEKN